MPAFGFAFTLSALLQLALAALATKEPPRSSVLQPDSTATHSAAAAPSIPGPGWQEIINHNVPRGRTAPAVCAGPWGIMSFAGAIHEHRMVNETWLLPALGGNWTFLPPAAGRPHPIQRAVSGIARYGDGCLMFGGTALTPGTYGPDHSVATPPSFAMLNDTWYWTLAGGWEELHFDVAPPPRMYHTLKELSDGTLLLYGGRNELYGAREYSVGDPWVFNGTWSLLNLIVDLPHDTPNFAIMPPAMQHRNVPPPRWGHGMACGLTNTGPPMANNHTGYGKVECVMFGGSQVADEDYLADTWMLKVQTDEHGVETVPRQYFWEQQNSRFSPHGRWSFQMATCGSRVIFCGGSTDFRVSADEMWMWSPVNRIVEIPDHPPAHLGEWTRLFGTDAIEDADWGAGGRPDAAGPPRPTGYALFNIGAIGASDIIMFAGAINQFGGNFHHKGFETAQMWRWACSAEAWPDAVLASPPLPPNPPPPPSFPPGEWGGINGEPAYVEPALPGTH